ncbi:MAG: cytochrome c oxidase assembly factor Coa1 family protein [Flavobacteriaceae bacterium]
MTDLIEQKSWFKRNWKWFLPSIIVLSLVLGLLFSTKLGGNIVGMAKVYLESSVCDNALEIAKKNKRVIQLLGELQPLNKLAILEGSHKYSNDYNTLDITVKVTGSEKKIKSKMDISADKNGDEWVYKTINIRIKSPEHLKQTIEVIEKFE